MDGPLESAIASSLSSSGTEYDHGMHDDCKLTYSDPLYTNILSSYQGYDDDDIKDAGKGYLDEILEFARKRGIFGMNSNNSLSFRFATYVDEEMLTSLAQKVRSTNIISANGSRIQNII